MVLMLGVEEQNYIEQTLQGDHSAYAALVNTHKDHVFTLLFRMVRQRETAEELAQDVFVKAFRHLHAFNRQARFSTWLYRIAYNTAISHLRKRKYTVYELEEQSFHVPNDDEQTEKEQRLNALSHAVAQLLPQEAALITLFYTENKSMSDICSITGQSLPNVKTKIHRIRTKLRTQLEGALNDE